MNVKQVLSLPLLAMMSAIAAPPELQTPEPVIYLADNIDEQEALGWCIDTLGRGWSEQLQTHSCKPQGGDVQFAYDSEARRIMSVEFPGKCATLNESADAEVPFDLLDCDATSTSQSFIYDAEALEFTLESDRDLCLAAGAESRTAGPYMARDLELAPCASTDAALKQWIVRGEL